MENPPDLVALKQSVLPVLQHLKDNSHHLLALQFALHMTFTVKEMIVPVTEDLVSYSILIYGTYNFSL